jgi:ubiquinone/menaquinone biosynthesis C-methylase UbiE
MEEPRPYFMPFKAGDKVIELGGGPGSPGTERPIIRPNLDSRPGPMVDIVANLEERLPLESNAWQGTYCAFALEHLSWRKVRGFIAEVYRILAPGGLAVFVTADTYAQCKKALETAPENWGDNISNLLFGGQDYSDNTHKVALSRAGAIKMFKEAGFWDVQTLDHPGIMGPNGYEKVTTDFIIEARKSAAQSSYEL